MTAYIFPGQGAQFSGMGHYLYQNYSEAKNLFHQANDILGFEITKIMFAGTDEELKQTIVTQPAIFLHSVVAAYLAPDFKPDMVAGHSLGEFSALVANKSLSFEDGLKLVLARAGGMQKACELAPSTMAAVIGLEDAVVEQICASIADEVVVPANYNCPGQLVISGSVKGIEIACAKLLEAGARRALALPVGGAFHSPFMEPAQTELARAINQTQFRPPTCAVYQNASATGSTDLDEIRSNLIVQLTAPVQWSQSVQNMIADGASKFIECGPGRVLQGLIRKINREAALGSLSFGQ